MDKATKSKMANISERYVRKVRNALSKKGYPESLDRPHSYTAADCCKVAETFDHMGWYVILPCGDRLKQLFPEGTARATLTAMKTIIREHAKQFKQEVKELGATMKERVVEDCAYDGKMKMYYFAEFPKKTK